MKKKLVVMLLGVCSFVGFAQEEQEEVRGIKNLEGRKHELRLDAAEALAIPALDVSYEYVISKYSGAGISMFIGFGNDELDEYQTFAITPFYRQYFFNKKDYGARGFYAEGVLQYTAGKQDAEIGFGEVLIDNNDVTWSRFGIGFALGQKWVSRNGFIIDLSLGLGRNLNSEDGPGPEVFFRGGVNVGYRF